MHCLQEALLAHILPLRGYCQDQLFQKVQRAVTMLIYQGSSEHFINDIRENTIADKMVPGCKKPAIEITGILKINFSG